jgi:arginase
VSVLWVDAHGDFNTEETTPSGNIHGMVLSALAGFGYSPLVNFGGWSPKIDAGKIVIVGARALDPGEQALLRKQHIHVFTMSEIDERGIHHVMEEALAVAGRDNSPFHVSLDLVGLDPQEAPGVGTPIRGGLSYREAHLVMEHVCDSGRMVSMDVVEVNPLLDQKNETASLAVELIRSALGKKIL